MTQGPPPFDETVAATLRRAKSDIVMTPAEGSGSGPSTLLTQHGAGVLDGRFLLPHPPPQRAITEPTIDMFVCGSNGGCEPTGSDPALIDFWAAPVEAMASTVFRALSAHGVMAGPTASVTASLTPYPQVVGEAHFDDDQYLPDDGVGVVAIVSSDIGPRIATGAISVASVRPGLPVELSPETVSKFSDGSLPHQQCAAEHIVIFGQFGQLHAGPVLPDALAVGDGIRRLLVFRAPTVPT